MRSVALCARHRHVSDISPRACFLGMFLRLTLRAQMDDFGWGSTRIVMGEQGKRLLVHVCFFSLSTSSTTDLMEPGAQDEGKFDPSSIPHKKWEAYEQELWEKACACPV
jgi:chitin synthase